MAEREKVVYNITHATIVQGDTVGKKTEIHSEEIGVVQSNAGRDEPEGNLSQDVERMNLRKIESDDFQTRRMKRPGSSTSIHDQVKSPTPSVRAQILTGRDEPDENLSRDVARMNLRIIESDDFQTRRIKTPGSLTSIHDQVKSPTPSVRAQILTEKAVALFGKSDYAGTVMLLDEPCVLEGNLFLPNLLLAECYMHLGKPHRANEMIDAVRKIVMSSGLKPDEVKEYADDFMKESLQTRAIILLRIASDLFESSVSSPDDLVNGIFSCISETCGVTEPMIEAGGESRKIGIQYGINFMTQMLNRLIEVKNANPENKARQIAWLCNYIGYIGNLAKEYEKSINIHKIGIETMERQFGSNASKYRDYGHQLQNIGAVHFSLSEFSEAESYFVKAVEAREKATDYDDENEKQEDIETSKQDLKEARQKLGKTC